MLRVANFRLSDPWIHLVRLETVSLSGVGLTNGLYKFTAYFGDDPPEPMQLYIGDSQQGELLNTVSVGYRCIEPVQRLVTDEDCSGSDYCE